MVGAVVVAVATGTLELAKTIIARLRGQYDVGLGNILGSNVLKALFVASAAAPIRPYAVSLRELMPSLIFGLVTTLIILPGRSGVMGRWRGFVLLGMYAVYVTWELRAA